MAIGLPDDGFEIEPEQSKPSSFIGQDRFLLAKCNFRYVNIQNDRQYLFSQLVVFHQIFEGFVVKRVDYFHGFALSVTTGVA